MRPLINSRCIHLPSVHSVIVAELHFGLGETVGGILAANTIFEAVTKELSELIDSLNVKTVIIDGDIKDSVSQPTKIEISFLKRFGKMLDEKAAKGLLVKGNHDGQVESVIDFPCVPSYQFVDHGKSVLIFHGNTVPAEASSQDTLVTAHLHPQYRYSRSKKEFVWLFMERKKGMPRQIVIIPPFNRFVGGGEPSSNRVPVLKKFYGSGAEWTTYVIAVNGFLFGGMEVFGSQKRSLSRVRSPRT